MGKRRHVPEKKNITFETKSVPSKHQTQEAPEPIADAADMCLAGRPLELPRFFPVSWVPGQKFGPEDDPDRTGEPWSVPSFCSRDPALQRASLVVKELELPSKPKAYSFARVVHNVLNGRIAPSLFDW